MTTPYPNLGWDPAPGVPTEVNALQSKVTSAATALRNCHAQLQKLIGESSYWEGDAATAFREAIDGELPTYIKNAARSLEKASAQLKIWDGDLTSNRDLAKKYDEAAAEKKTATVTAQRRHDAAAGHPDLKLAGQTFPSQEEADTATERLRAAEKSLGEATTALNSANAAYDDVIRKAEELEHQHTDQAEGIARALDDATDKLAPREPGWLSKAVDAIWDGIKAVGDFLYEHAGTIGAIAGMLALFPTPLAPLFAGIAVVASAASMTKNMTDPEFRSALWGDKAGWNMDTFSAWSSVAGDALGVVPGIGALGTAGKEVAGAARMAGEGGEVVSASAKATEFVKDVVPAFSRTAETSAREGAAGIAAGGKEAAKRVADISVNGVNVGANLVSSGESLGVVPEEGAAHNTAEVLKSGATLHSLAGLLGVA
ncbi:putative T7SS-secreted protein [Streptomyces sp. NPDC050738]|uniref:putative T7SS-secreted protein n=1 Tax=Streptomyces sp. NPDC050738 TaxID=3154744 RepID=UPI00342713E5